MEIGICAVMSMAEAEALGIIEIIRGESPSQQKQAEAALIAAGDPEKLN